MSDQSSVDALKSQHAELEAKIVDEHNRPLPDDAVIQDLKRQKLRIKDELAQLGG